jgi:hypothetical protein
MRFKGTLVLLIVVLVLGGFIYFYEIKGGAQREKAKESESLIWKIEDRNIRQIELSSPGQHAWLVRLSHCAVRISSKRMQPTWPNSD